MKSNLQNLLIVIFLFSIGHFNTALAEGDGSNASDPTAAINYVDFRFQAFDLDDSRNRDRYAVEGAYVITPEHKITYEINYWETDITGKDESGLESVKSKYIYLQPRMLSSGLKYKLAIGTEVILDQGDVDEGIGTGTDQIAPLFGAGWLFSERNFFITLVQYFHSVSEDDGAEKVRVTGPRFIWIHKIPSIRGWLKVDNKFAIDHEDDNHTSNIIEIQLGRMFTPSIGAYVEYLNNNAGVRAYDDGIGVGLRIAF